MYIHSSCHWALLGDLKFKNANKISTTQGKGANIKAHTSKSESHIGFPQPSSPLQDLLSFTRSFWYKRSIAMPAYLLCGYSTLKFTISSCSWVSHSHLLELCWMMWFLFIDFLWKSLLTPERTLVSICWLTAWLVIQHVWADAGWHNKNALKAVYSRLPISNCMWVSC